MPDPALAEIAGETRRRRSVVLEKGGIAVDPGAKALAQDQFAPRSVEMGVKSGTSRALDAMIRPQCLFAIVHLDRLEGPFARMARCETRMVGRMPVLGQDQMLE